MLKEMRETVLVVLLVIRADTHTDRDRDGSSAFGFGSRITVTPFCNFWISTIYIVYR